MKPTPSLMLRELQRVELHEAARLAGRGMCDNPSDVKMFPIPDTQGRGRALERFFRPVLSGLFRRGLILGAFRGSTLLGVCGMAKPGLCQATPLEKVRVLPSAVFGNPIGTPLRVLAYVAEWARRDPSEPHWHLGPVAVEPELRGRGIGAAMLAEFCSRMDDCQALSYLETDKAENVRFYQRFGFTVVAEAEVLGVANWFMSRQPRTAMPLRSACAPQSC